MRLLWIHKSACKPFAELNIPAVILSTRIPIQKTVLEVADVRNKLRYYLKKKKKVVHFQSFGIVCIPPLCEPTQINTKVS